LEQKILVVDDEQRMRKLVRDFLVREDFQVMEAADGESAVDIFLSEKNIDLVILDVMMPKMDGWQVCREIRQYSKVPIIMLTARDTELDEIKALELGADDYMSKPFSVAVLKARVKKMLKNTEHSILKSGNIRVDLSNGKVTKNEEEIELSSTELKLLVYFIKNTGLILSKEQILMKIWENDGEFVDDNIVSVNIRRLRIKIESDAKNPQHIKTVHGMWYIWKEVL